MTNIAEEIKGVDLEREMYAAIVNAQQFFPVTDNNARQEKQSKRCAEIAIEVSIGFANFLHKYYPNTLKKYPHPKDGYKVRKWMKAFFDENGRLPEIASTEELFYFYIKNFHKKTAA